MRTLFKRIKRNAVSLEFCTALILYILYISEYSSYLYDYLSYVQSVVYTLIFFSFVILYLMDRRKGTYRTAFHMLFAMLLVLFIALFFTPYPVFVSQVLVLNSVGHIFGTYLTFLLLPYLLFALGAYAYRVRGNKQLGSIFFALAFSVVLILFGYVFVQFHIGDEVFLAYSAVQEMLNGMNPYTASVASLLYVNINTIGATLTTNNTIIGKMDYPALYFLSFAPFYFISTHTITGLTNVDIKIQLAIFLSLFLLSMFFLFDKRSIFTFRPAFIVFLTFLRP